MVKPFGFLEGQNIHHEKPYSQIRQSEKPSSSSIGNTLIRNWASDKRLTAYNALKATFVELGAVNPATRKRRGICLFCQSEFREGALAVYHLRKTHFSSDLMEFVCPEIGCEVTAWSKQDILDHLKMAHPSTPLSGSLKELDNFIRPKEGITGIPGAMQTKTNSASQLRALENQVLPGKMPTAPQSADSINPFAIFSNDPAFE